MYMYGWMGGCNHTRRFFIHFYFANVFFPLKHIQGQFPMSITIDLHCDFFQHSACTNFQIVFLFTEI